MDKIILLDSSTQLKQVSVTSAEEYQQKSELLIAKINTLMLQKATIKALIGEDNVTMMKDNHANHVRFMLSIFKSHNPEVLLETILWVFRAYRSHGFTTNYWATQLNTWISILKEDLTTECFSEIFPYYEWMQINIPLFVKLSDEKQVASQSLH